MVGTREGVGLVVAQGAQWGEGVGGGVGEVVEEGK